MIGGIYLVCGGLLKKCFPVATKGENLLAGRK
jgi:hypothetical protein